MISRSSRYSTADRRTTYPARRMGSSTIGPSETRLTEVCDLLGYFDSLRSPAFQMWTGKRRLVLDLACFARPEPKDMSTAALVAGAASGGRRHMELRDGARYLAAPAAIIETGDRIELWRVGSDRRDDQRVSDHLHVIEESPDLRRIRDALSPQAIMRAKQDQQRQLTFFNIDVTLLQEARNRLAGSLESRVRAAFGQLWPSTHGDPDPGQARALARTVGQAITTLAIRDKIAESRDLQDAVAIFQERFNDDGAAAEPDQIAKAAGMIGEGIAFDGLDAIMLSDLYESVIISRETRKHLGAYYTPPQLARRILSAVPAEEITPDQRRVLDPTCGSGTLLLAASERLAESAPSETGPGHRYVRERLFGFDRDGFAVELSKLALLLHALPQGNGWNVRDRDALIPRSSNEIQATMVVGNPPWQFERGAGVSNERATDFLNAMLSWCVPGGFVAAVMPASWLTAKTARNSRRTIREVADIFEVWRLPRSVFKSSDAPPCVLFARKNPSKSSGHWLYRTVSRGHVSRFYAGDDVAFPGILAEQATADAPLTAKPPSLAQHLVPFSVLGSVAELRGGVPADQKGAIGGSGGPYLCLTKSTVTPPFAPISKQSLVACRYPEDFSRGPSASPAFYLQPKVLVAVTNSVDSPKRTRAMLDEFKAIPRNSMVAVVPNQNNRLNRLALTAILGSRVVNAWLQSATTRQIRVDQMKELPVPPIETWPALAQATELVHAAYSASRDPAEEMRALEGEVERAYGLDDNGSRDVTALLGESSLELNRVSNDTFGDERLAVGSVLDVASGKLLLDVAGITDPQGEWVSPPGGMPGWLMRRGATFDAVGVERGLEWGRYFIQEMAWRTDQDLFPEV